MNPPGVHTCIEKQSYFLLTEHSGSLVCLLPLSASVCQPSVLSVSVTLPVSLISHSESAKGQSQLIVLNQ